MAFIVLEGGVKLALQLGLEGVCVVAFQLGQEGVCEVGFHSPGGGCEVGLAIRPGGGV